MNILERIEKNVPNKLLTRLHEGQKQGIPLLMWGAGSIGHKAFVYLQKNNIELSDVFAADDQPNQIFNGKSVLSLKDACAKYSSFNVFIARVVRNEKGDDLECVKNVINKFHIDPAFFFHEADFDFDYVVSNKDAFSWTYDNLFDDFSKRSFVEFLNSRINKVCENIVNFYCEEKYFNDDIIKYSDLETYVDCGVYRNSTIQKFKEALKRNTIENYDSIYVFESDKLKFDELRRLSYTTQNLHCINKRAWSEQTVLNYDPNALWSMGQEDGRLNIETDTVDNVLNGKKATFIRTSIGGSSFNVIKGAKDTISRFRPKLVITVYCKADEMITIPQYVKNLIPEYKLYFRFHTLTSLETVLYAVCE